MIRILISTAIAGALTLGTGGGALYAYEAGNLLIAALSGTAFSIMAWSLYAQINMMLRPTADVKAYEALLKKVKEQAHPHVGQLNSSRRVEN